MSESDLELERLERATQDAHARFLRLQNFTDPAIVRSATDLWQAAVADLAAYRQRTRPKLEE